jgi:hypothetical protein
VKPDICFTRCMINGNIRQACMRECKKKTQSEKKVLNAPSKFHVENKCASTCYTHCYSDKLGQECFDSCLEQCRPRETEEFKEAVQQAGLLEKSLTAPTCIQNCYLSCLVGGTIYQPCFSECSALCPASEEAGSVALSLVPTNCGQICFQQCYVNFQMIFNCYLPCVTSCLGSSSSIGKAVSLEREQRPVPGNQCEWECFVSSWSDSFFYSSTYTKCTSSLCKSSLSSGESSSPSLSSSCISSCRKLGKVDAKCFDLCLHPSSFSQESLKKFQVLEAEPLNLVL